MDNFRQDLEYSNYRELEYLGVNKWHSLGYLGEGIRVGNREDETDPHGQKTKSSIKLVAPNCEILTYIDLDKIKDNNLDVFTMSLLKSWKKDLERLANGVGNTICCCSIGNSGVTHYNKVVESNILWGIGACALADNWKPIPTDYSSASEYCDFMSFSNIYINKKIVSGTSFSSPLFAGMIALVQEYFLKNAGRKLYRNEMYRFVKEHCVDLGDKGKDDASGYGIFILPDPMEIDIEKYIGDDEMLRYNSYEECPDWSKATIKKLMEKGTLQGDQEGNLDLSMDMIRMLVINDREHLYDYE